MTERSDAPHGEQLFRQLLARVEAIGEERQRGYRARLHGDIVNKQCADAVVQMLGEIQSALQAPVSDRAPIGDLATAMRFEEGAHPLVEGDLATQREIADRAQPCVVVPSLLPGLRRAHELVLADDPRDYGTNFQKAKQCIVGAIAKEIEKHERDCERPHESKEKA